ncbi:MAG: hypothetical protein ABFC77_01825 [Thermoguttaceae bacterium]
MNEPLHHQLLGHLLGALDDDEQRNADARLQRDPQYRRLWREWRRRLIPLDAVRPDFEPPAGLADRTCRYVAAFGFDDATSSRRRRFSGKMTPSPAPPVGRSRAGLLDVAAVATVLLLAAALILPALNDSRFNSRVAACQNNMRQFGLALSQYSRDQLNDLEDLAVNGRLTRAGEHAAWLLRAGEPETACSDVWLSIQGALRGSANLKPATKFPFRDVREWVAQNDEPVDLWRVGTSDDRPAETSPLQSPLLADAPGVNVPGQHIAVHDGQGRNAMFEDGHVNFLPREPGDEPNRAIPVIFVGLQR